MEDIAIEVRGVGKKFGPKWAIRSCSTTFAKGSTAALIGTSGSGKSTLLRLIVGLYWPDEGEVIWDGKPLDPEALQSIRLRTGYVLQDGGLFPHLSVFENIAIVARYLKWEDSRIKNRVNELLDLVRLPAELASRRPMQLSGGQRQRVGFARSLMLNPEVLLLDEPFGALDPITRFDLQTETKQIISSLGKTVILVTHDIHEAEYFSDRLVLMDDGHIIQSGSFKDLQMNPKNEFVSRFISAQSTRRSEVECSN